MTTVDEPRTGLATALAAFQAELPKVGKDRTAKVEGKEGKRGYEYKYADLAVVSSIAMPLLGKHGLSFSAKPMLDESGRFVLRYVLRHVSGESDGGDFPLSSTGQPQQIGSLLTYARRYCLLAVTGLAPEEEDDDGKAANDLQIGSHDRPAEKTWDPVDQQVLYDGWADEIGKAGSVPEITAIGDRVIKARNAGEISPSTYRKLDALAGRRIAELKPVTP